MLILHCKTTYCYQTTSPSTTTMLGTLTTYTLSSSLGWFRVVKSIKKERHAVFFTAANPMFVDQHKKAEYDLTNPRIAVYKNTWTIHQHTWYWCNLKLAQRKGLQFYQTRSNAIIFYNTLTAICIEKVENMKSGEELYNKVYQSPRLPRRAALEPNLHHGRQGENIRPPPKQRMRSVRRNPWR